MLCLVRGHSLAGVNGRAIVCLKSEIYNLTPSHVSTKPICSGKECWCGDSAPEDRVTADSECNNPCPGDPSQICGGFWRINVFREWAYDHLAVVVILVTLDSFKKHIFFHYLFIAVAGDTSSGYVPGTPGAPWTDEEVKIVQEKVRLTSHESEC